MTDISKRFFTAPVKRPNDWPDEPDLRKAVEWFKAFITEREWKQRRSRQALRCLPWPT